MVGITTTATTSTISPYLIIWVIGTLPDAYTMAFGGVETGRMTAAEVLRRGGGDVLDIHAALARGHDCDPAGRAVD